MICGKKVVSASVGASYYPIDGTTAEELLSEADRTMYEAKETHYRKKGVVPMPQLLVTSEG